MASRDLRVVISGDPRGLSRAFASAERSAGKFGAKVEGVSTRTSRALGMLARSGAVTAGLGFGAMLRAGVDFEKQMARVEAVSGATGKQMSTLTDLAKKMGAQTKFSAGDAAEGMYELASAGFKVSEMSTALPGVLAAAAAGNIELADASEIVANALRGFGLESSKSTHVADVLTKAVNESSVEFKDLQLTMKYIGPVAKLTGQSMEDMVAVVEAMGNAGIKGEQAGTSLRAGLIRLVKPTKMAQEGLALMNLTTEDLQGPNGLKPLPELLGIIGKHTEGMSKAQKAAAITAVFGTEAASGMSAAIAEGSKKLRENSDALKHSDGSAKAAAKIMNDTVAGAWENFTGSVETASISIYEKFAPALHDGLLGAAGFVNDLAKMPGKIKAEFEKLSSDKGAGAAIGTMIARGFEKVPWNTIGKRLSAGISGALDFGDQMTANVAAGIGAAFSKVNGRQVLGKLVDVIGEAIDALFSPSFWQEHWKGILSAVTLVIPVGKLLKIPGFGTLYRFISKPVFRAVEAMGKGALSLFGKAGGEAGVRFLVEIEKVAPRLAGFLLRLVTLSGRSLSKLPGRLAGIAGDAASAVARALGNATGVIVGKITGWAIKGLAALGRRVRDFVTSGSKLGRSIASGLLLGLAGLADKIADKIKSAVKSAAGTVGGWIDKANPFSSITGNIGDGIGKSAIGAGGVLPSGGAFGGNLMGARPAMRPFAAIGSRFGLHVSSGRRPGSITSSGNVSWHSTGEAIDMADGRGPDANKMAYFKYMRSHYGPRLAELIYTPAGGAQIKNGQSYQYGGQVARDHYDHVHVAFDSGRPGQGDGLGRFKGDGFGKFDATSYGPPWGGIQGTGVTATGVNLKDGRQYHGIAVDPSVIPLHKRVKVWPNPFGWRGTFETFDTGGAIKGRRIDFYDWRGRAKQNAWGHRSVTVSTGGSDSPSGGGGGGGSHMTPTQRRAYRRFGASQGFHSSQVAGAVGEAQAEGTDRGYFIPSGGQEQSDIDLAKATASAKDDLPGMIKALQQEKAKVRRRIKHLRRYLKRKRIKPASRQKFTDELATLIGTLADINALLKEYRADAAGGATTISAAEGLTAGVAPEGSHLSADGSSVIENAEPAEPDTSPTRDDWLNLDLAQAQTTTATGDDLAVLGKMKAAREADLAAANKTLDPRLILEALNNLTAVNDQIKALNETAVTEAETRQRLIDETKALKDEMKTYNEFSRSVAGIATREAVRALADMISGEIVGTNLQGRRLTAGNGTVAITP